MQYEELINSLRKSYEERIKALEEKHKIEIKAKERELKIYRQHIESLEKITMALAQKNVIYNSEFKSTVRDMSENYSTSNQGANIGNFANKMQDNASMQANMYSTEQKQNLAEAAVEIQQLLFQLSQTNPTTDEAVTEVIHQVIRRNPTLKARLQSALKAGGLEALKAIFNHPLFSIPAETVKGWLEAE